jgi:hypothetical protein
VTVNSSATANWCVTTWGIDNNSTTNATCEVWRRGQTSVSSGGSHSSTGTGAFTLDDDVSVTSGDALMISCSIPKCVISAGTCDAFGVSGEGSSISHYRVVEC